MGRAKHEWIEAEERGWSAPEGFVCEDCVDDPYLKQVIARNLASRKCNFCGQGSRGYIAASVEALMPDIAGAVFYFYNDPTHAGMPWDEGPLFRGVSTEDALMSLPLNCHDELFEAVAEAFSFTEWVRSAGGHWSSSHDHEILKDSWHSFVTAVKHQTRFHFHQANLSDLAGPQELEPGHVLAAIGRLVTEVDLIGQVSPGTVLHRCRTKASDAEWEPNASTMGAPPPEKARAGRMNPAGISYLYCALEEKTALGETLSAPPVEVAVAAFVVNEPLTVLDLCSLPPAPSIFDGAARATLEALKFLDSFVSEIATPVKKDGSEHIDYVPSQVVCEWFAQVFRPSSDSAHLDGILYPSSVVPGGRNLVVFPTERALHRAFGKVSYQGSFVRSLSNWELVLQNVVPTGPQT